MTPSGGSCRKLPSPFYGLATVPDGNELERGSSMQLPEMVRACIILRFDGVAAAAANFAKNRAKAPAERRT